MISSDDEVDDDRREEGHAGTIATIVVVCIVAVIAYMIFGPCGAICKGVGKALGTVGTFISGTISGCTVQPDCSTLSTASACEKADPNCTWVDSKKTDGGSYCANTTGRKVGSGGFFSSKCVLGMGMISAMILSIFGPLLLSFVKNRAVKNLANNRGEPLSKTAKEIGEQSVRSADRAIRDVEANTGELSEADKEHAAELVTHKITLARLNLESEGTGSSSDKEAAADAQAQAEAAAARVSEERRSEVEAAADRAAEEEVARARE